MKLVACVTDPLAVRRILDHLGLSSPEKPRPPPTREITIVPVDDEGRELVTP
jgi:hypothetical protein